MKDRRVLVTGATGFVGSHVARRLTYEGATVQGLVRDPARAEPLAKDGVELVVGDLRDPASLRAAVGDVEIVFYITALFCTEKPAPEQFWEVNAEGTRRLLEVAREEGIRRFVHCSSVGVHGEFEDPPADEGAPLEPDDHCQASKLAGERYAREYFERGDMQVTDFRSGGIYGPGDTRFLKLFRAIAKGRFVMVGSGQVLYQLVYIDDFVNGILLCGSKPEAVGEVFILTGAKTVVLNEFAGEIAAAVGSEIPSVHLPAPPVYAAAVICETVCRPLGIQPPLYRRRMDFFLKDRAFDIGKAREQLGFEPEVDLATGVRRTATWYRERDLL